MPDDDSDGSDDPLPEMEMDLFDEYVGYLEEKNVAFADRYVPFFLCSAGCHLLNIKQQRSAIYAESGRYPNLRLNVMMVAPPGFSKTFFIELLLDPDIGLLGTSVIDTRYTQIVTEAGFVGTDARSSDGNEDDTPPGVPSQPGDAWEYRNGIIGCEEFDSVLQMMQTEHSSNLDNAMLTALDSGRVRKRLAHEDIDYRTNVTMFGATQPTRMELSSGFSRRFMFLKFYPTADEMDALKKSRRNGRGVDADFRKMSAFREAMQTLERKVAKVNMVTGLSKLDPIFDENSLSHHEEPIYERMAMGYSVLKKGSIQRNDDGTVVLEIVKDDKISSMIQQAIDWRKQLSRAAEGEQILSLLRSHDGMMPTREIHDMLLKYSVDAHTAQYITNRMIDDGLVTEHDRRGTKFLSIPSTTGRAWDERTNGRRKQNPPAERYDSKQQKRRN